jgi:hypothetical protein
MYALVNDITNIITNLLSYRSGFLLDMSTPAYNA